MVNLILTPSNSSPELTFSEYEPHFNYIVKTTRTPTYIATKYPNLFYHRNLAINLYSLKETKKTLSSTLSIPIKYINTINFPKSRISVDYKIFEKSFEIIPQNIVNIPNNSKILDYFDTLKYVDKIITEQEIFVYFAYVYNVTCLAFYDDWNPNFYKSQNNITLLPTHIRNKEEIIYKFAKI